MKVKYAFAKWIRKVFLNVRYPRIDGCNKDPWCVTGASGWSPSRRRFSSRQCPLERMYVKNENSLLLRTTGSSEISNTELLHH